MSTVVSTAVSTAGTTPAPAKTVDPPLDLPPGLPPHPSNLGLRILQIYVATILVIPSDMVFAPLGASGYVASVVALLAFGVNAVWVVTDFDRRRWHGNALRHVLILFWMVTLASYLKFQLAGHDATTGMAADRWLLRLLGLTGVIVIAASSLHSTGSVMRLLRATTWAGAFCGLVAGLQFWAGLDLSPALHQIPGLVINGDLFGIQARGSLNRVAGTTLHPIELGTTAAMLLPLGLHVLVFDTERALWRRLVPCLLMASSILASVSRSAILATIVGLGVYVLAQPPARRLIGFALAPVMVIAVFVSTPGLIGTLLTLFQAGTTDTSIATRVGDYPFVSAKVMQSPWLGSGGGTFLPQNTFEILDNQYLSTVIELGLLGMVAVVVYLLVPVVVALRSWHRAADLETASLSAACAGASLSAALSCLTFDAFSFSTFVGVHGLILGLVAVTARLTAPPRRPVVPAGHRRPATGPGLHAPGTDSESRGAF